MKYIPIDTLVKSVIQNIDIIVIDEIDINKKNDVCLFCYKPYPITCDDCTFHRDCLIIFVVSIMHKELILYFIDKSSIRVSKELKIYIQYTYAKGLVQAQDIKNNSYILFESFIKKTVYATYINNYMLHLKANNKTNGLRYIIVPEHTTDESLDPSYYLND